MSHQPKVMLCGITTLSDARYAAAAAIEYLGFCFDDSAADYIPPVKAREIFEWTSGSLIVGEFGHQPAEEIRDIADLLEVDLIEINNHLTVDELPQFHKPIIKKIDLADFDKAALELKINAYREHCYAFHFFSSSPLQPDSAELASFCREVKVIWGLPFDLSSIKDIIHRFQPYALALPAGREEKTGLKAFDTLADFLDIIRGEGI